MTWMRKWKTGYFIFLYLMILIYDRMYCTLVNKTSHSKLDTGRWAGYRGQ